MCFYFCPADCRVFTNIFSSNKNIPKQSLADTNKQLTDKIVEKTLPKELIKYFSAISTTCCLWSWARQTEFWGNWSTFVIRIYLVIPDFRYYLFFHSYCMGEEQVKRRKGNEWNWKHCLWSRARQSKFCRMIWENS